MALTVDLALRLIFGGELLRGDAHQVSVGHCLISKSFLYFNDRIRFDIASIIIIGALLIIFRSYRISNYDIRKNGEILLYRSN